MNVHKFNVSSVYVFQRPTYIYFDMNKTGSNVSYLFQFDYESYARVDEMFDNSFCFEI